MVNRVGCALVLVGVWSLPALAQEPGEVTAVVKIAVDPSVGGTTNSGGSGMVNGRAVDLTETGWDQTHSRRAPLFVGGVAIGLAPRFEALANLEYGRAGADEVVAGMVDGAPLTVTFDTYSFWGLEGGVRLGLSDYRGVYAIVTGGFRRTSRIDARFDAPDVDVFLSSGFYEASSVPSFGIGGGMAFGTLGFEVMLKYAGKPSPAATIFEGSTLDDVNRVGARWSLPISFVLQF